jgi:hypothetical protein
MQQGPCGTRNLWKKRSMYDNHEIHDPTSAAFSRNQIKMMPTDGRAIPRISYHAGTNAESDVFFIRGIALPSVGASFGPLQKRIEGRNSLVGADRDAYTGSQRTYASVPKKSSRPAKKKTVGSVARKRYGFSCE